MSVRYRTLFCQPTLTPHSTVSRVNVVQWNEDLYEEQLVERTKDACGGPVDIVIDFSATSRSIRRALKCLAPVSNIRVL